MKPIQVRLNPMRARDKDISSGLSRIESPRERAEFIRQAVYSALYPKYKPGITNEDLAMRIDNLRKVVERIVDLTRTAHVEAPPVPLEEYISDEPDQTITIPQESSLNLAPTFTAALKKAARPGMRYEEGR